MVSDKKEKTNKEKGYDRGKVKLDDPKKLDAKVGPKPNMKARLPSPVPAPRKSWKQRKEEAEALKNKISVENKMGSRSSYVLQTARMTPGGKAFKPVAPS